MFGCLDVWFFGFFVFDFWVFGFWDFGIFGFVILVFLDFWIFGLFWIFAFFPFEVGSYPIHFFDCKEDDHSNEPLSEFQISPIYL